MKKLFYMLLTFVLFISFTYSQEKDSLIQIYPGIGDTIDLFDREFFNLYSNVDGIQEASLYIRDKNKLVSRLKLQVSNRIVDTIAINSLSSPEKVRTNISKIDKENDKRLKIEADVLLSLNDSRSLSGKLSMYSKNYLYLFSEKNDENKISQSQDLKIPTSNVNEVIILGQNKTWSHAGWGALIGLALGGILGLASGDDESGLVQFQQEEKALGLGMTLGIIGGLIGLISGSSSSTDDQIINYNSQLDLLKLKDYAKYYFQYDESVEKNYLELE